VRIHGEVVSQSHAVCPSVHKATQMPSHDLPPGTPPAWDGAHSHYCCQTLCQLSIACNVCVSDTTKHDKVIRRDHLYQSGELHLHLYAAQDSPSPL